MKDKKGVNFTLEKSINMVLAVAVIIVLIYVGYKISMIFIQKYEIEQAEEFVRKIEEKIAVAESGKDLNPEFLIFNPRGWGFTTVGDFFCVSEDEHDLGDDAARANILEFYEKEGNCKNFPKVVFKQKVDDGESETGWDWIELEKEILPIRGTVIKSGSGDSATYVVLFEAPPK